MARRSYSSRYSRSSRRRSSGGRSRRFGGKKRSRYTTKRRNGRAGVLAEVKFVNNIAGRAHPPADWTSLEIGPTVVRWRGQAEETGSLNSMDGVKALAGSFGAGVDYNGSRYGLTSKSYLLTHCNQGFEASKRIGLAINPRSFLLRATVTAGRIAQLTATKFGFGDGEAVGVSIDTNNGAGGAAPITSTTSLLGQGQGLGAVTNGVPLYTTQFCRTSLRIVVFRDMEPPLIGAATEEPRVWSDLFSTSGASGGSTSDFLRTDNIGRYAVVTDTTIDLDGDDPQKSIQLRVPISKTLRYGGSGANHIRAGHYFMVCCAEMLSVNGANPDVTFLPPVISYQHRMAFTDS